MSRRHDALCPPKRVLPAHLAKHAAFPDDVMPLVEAILKEGGDTLAALRRACKDLPKDGMGYGHVYFNTRTKQVWVSVGDWEEDLDRWKRPLEKVKGVKDVRVEAEAGPPKYNGEPWLQIKKAYSPTAHALAQLTNFQPSPVNALVGGPSPLAASLTTGLLGAGLGYGAGWLGEQFLPEEQFRPGHLRKTLALAGGALGAAPGIWWGTIAHRAHPTKPGWRAWLSGWPFRPEDRGGPPPAPVADEPLPEDYLKAGAVKQAQGLYGQADQHYLSAIGSDYGVSGLTAVPIIPARDFNQAVRDDPFTPRPIMAATTGLVDSAAAWRRSPVVSPMDVGRIAVGMGSGYASGMLVGKTLGALAGLRPEAQKTLQRAGTWAGILNNIVPLAFG